MPEIPVKFDYKGNHYEGHLSQVSGSGSTSMFFLTINKMHCGQLWVSSFNNQWVFKSNDGMFEELADYFGMVVTGWYC